MKKQLGITKNDLSPFNLFDEKAYKVWRDKKINKYPVQVEDLVVELKDPFSLTITEKEQIEKLCTYYNMAVYVMPPKYAQDRNAVKELGKHFGLTNLDKNFFSKDDSITSLTIVSQGDSANYIPYTDLAINWHTDGYYNSADKQVRSLILHCSETSAEGGENAVLDHEMLYILLRDENPEYISALSECDVMCIPPNEQNGVEIRSKRCGPVFSVDPQNQLHMRYTARQKNIVWKDNSETQTALSALEKILNSNSEFMINHRLESGQGLICNNVLHKRSAFTNDENNERLMFRARYYNRVEGAYAEGSYLG